MNDICPNFQPLRYPTDNDETELDTRLTLTISLDSDPSELSYPSYYMELTPLSLSTQLFLGDLTTRVRRSLDELDFFYYLCSSYLVH